MRGEVCVLPFYICIRTLLVQHAFVRVDGA